MKNKKGFTLIELIVVMAILGILAMILVPAFKGYAEDANMQVARSYAKNVEIAFRTANAKLSESGSTEEDIIFVGDNSKKQPIIDEMDKLLGDLAGKYAIKYIIKLHEPEFFITVLYNKTYYDFNCLSGSPIFIKQRVPKKK